MTSGTRQPARVRVTAGVVALISLTAAGCGARAEGHPIEAGAPAPATAPDETALATTSMAPIVPTWALTGHLADAAVLHLPVMAVKVDNSPWARPHAGINDADQVYELQVEGITRFMELYHSKQPDRIGPVRSARSSDIDLFGNLNRPLLVWSGGNPGVTAAVTAGAESGLLVDLGQPGVAFPDFYRDNANGREAPHNLYTSIPKLRADFTPADSAPPAPMFAFRPAGEALPATAVDAPGMTIDFGLGVRVEYVWDAERNGWDRFQVDERHQRAQSAFVDEANVQVAPDNVVILFLRYEPDTVDARSPKAISVGNGDGIVLTQGKAIAVHWDRPTAADGWNLTDQQTNAPVSLTPGRTWVALPDVDNDHALPIEAGEAGQLLTLRV